MERKLRGVWGGGERIKRKEGCWVRCVKPLEDEESGSRKARCWERSRGWRGILLWFLELLLLDDKREKVEKERKRKMAVGLAIYDTSQDSREAVRRLLLSTS